jgi:ribosomal-protein-alanine N-acetyltransferase
MIRLINITKENYQNYLERILEIENLSFPSPWSINAFKAEIRNPSCHLWGLIQGEVLIGYICFWMFDSEIQIVNIAVHPQNRRQKLGHYILTKTIETSLSKGIRHIWLEVRPSNLPAKKLYEKLGFKKVGRRPRYYTDTNEDAIIMSLDLTEKETLRLVSN